MKSNMIMDQQPLVQKKRSVNKFAFVILGVFALTAFAASIAVWSAYAARPVLNLEPAKNTCLRKEDRTDFGNAWSNIVGTIEYGNHCRKIVHLRSQLGNADVEEQLEMAMSELPEFYNPRVSRVQGRL